MKYGVALIVPMLALAPRLTAAMELPRENSVPGGIKIIRLDVAGEAPPDVETDGHRALVVQDGTGWVAVVGIPLAAPLGARLLTVRETAGPQQIEFAVGEKRYASQSLK